jgi:hypothetical protein
MPLMTIIYPGGTAVEALVVSAAPGSLEVAIAGSHEVRRFEQVEGAWISEARELVQIRYASQPDPQNAALAESDFVCPKKLGRQLISNLMSGEQEDGGNPFYVFAAEDQRVRITVIRSNQSPAA